MITSIFSKSKPVNIIIVSIAVIVIFILANYSQFTLGYFQISGQLLNVFLSLFLVFVLDFVIAKNDLTKKNSYGIMTLALVMAFFPEVLQNSNFLIANLLVAFALRRLLSLHSKRNIKKKLFDAAFWVALASLFYAWAILFVIVIIFAVFYYWQNEVKNIAITILGFVTAFIFLVCYNIIVKDEFLVSSNFNFEANLDFSGYNSLPKIITLTVVFAIYIWSLVFYAKGISDKNKKIRPLHILVIIASIVAIFMGIIAPQKNGGEFLFLFIPFAIIVSNYIETISERWFKEAFVTLMVITPILSLVL